MKCIICVIMIVSSSYCFCLPSACVLQHSSCTSCIIDEESLDTCMHNAFVVITDAAWQMQMSWVSTKQMSAKPCMEQAEHAVNRQKEVARKGLAV